VCGNKKITSSKPFTVSVNGYFFLEEAEKPSALFVNFLLKCISKGENNGKKEIR
jgi:hypothetical protein